jgi:hypothetical protein
MDTQPPRQGLRPVPAGATDILQELSNAQHLHPHESLDQALCAAIEATGVCPAAVQNALAWLQLDPSRSIGRCRRTELMQLARSIHSFGQRTASAHPGRPV